MCSRQQLVRSGEWSHMHGQAWHINPKKKKVDPLKPASPTAQPEPVESKNINNTAKKY